MVPTSVVQSTATEALPKTSSPPATADHSALSFGQVFAKAMTRATETAASEAESEVKAEAKTETQTETKTELEMAVETLAETSTETATETPTEVSAEILAKVPAEASLEAIQAGLVRPDLATETENTSLSHANALPSALSKEIRSEAVLGEANEGVRAPLPLQELTLKLFQQSFAPPKEVISEELPSPEEAPSDHIVFSLSGEFSGEFSNPTHPTATVRPAYGPASRETFLTSFSQRHMPTLTNSAPISANLSKETLELLSTLHSSNTTNTVNTASNISATPGLESSSQSTPSQPAPLILQSAPQLSLQSVPDPVWTTTNSQVQSPLSFLPPEIAPQQTMLAERFEVLKQMEQHIQRLQFERAEQKQQLQIQLKPAHLGKLHLQLQQEGQVFSLQIATESPLAKEMLEGQMQQLKQQFARMGFELGQVQVNVQQEGQHTYDEGRQAFEQQGFYPWPQRPVAAFSLMSQPGSTLSYGSAPSHLQTYYHQVNYLV